MKVDQEKDRLLYDYLKKYVEDHGYAPSIVEMCEFMGVSSTSTVHGRLTRLEQTGRIVRRGPRAISFP